MRNQQEIIFDAACLPITGRFAVVLLLDDKLLERKAGVLEYAHYLERHGHHAALLTCVAHEDGAESALFEDAEAFGGDRLHCLEEVPDLQPREVGLNVLAVLDDIRVRRMGAYEVDAAVRQEVEAAGVAFSYVNFAVRALMLKGDLLTAALERGFVHIDPDYISVQQLCLNKSGPASRELVEHQLALPRIAQQNIAGDIRGPAASKIVPFICRAVC